MLRIAVITVSDRASRGEYADKSGPALVECLRAAHPDMVIDAVIVPDEADAIRQALDRFHGRDWIITTGGTGIGPRDITPEITAAFCERALPGIAETLRRESYSETPAAMLSRGFAGLRGRTVVVNVPGSVKAAVFCARILAPIMAHARDMLAGKGH